MIHMRERMPNYVDMRCDMRKADVTTLEELMNVDFIKDRLAGWSKDFVRFEYAPVSNVSLPNDAIQKELLMLIDTGNKFWAVAWCTGDSLASIGLPEFVIANYKR